MSQTELSGGQQAGRAEPDPKRWSILAVVVIAQLMVVLDASIVTIALPSAQHALGISVANRQWVITAYTLTFGGLLLLGGRIADYGGRKRMFAVGLIGFAAASALGGLAVDQAMLFGARALQGAFAALMAPAALSILTITFADDPGERAKAFGAYGAVSGAGGAIGVLAGGLLTQYASWRWAFLLNVPLAVTVVAISRRHVPESRGADAKQVDWLGALAATVGLAGVVTGFLESARLGWASPLVLASFLGGLLFLSVFLVVEARSRTPMVPLTLFRSRAFLGANLFTVFLYATIGIFFFLFPMDLIQMQEYSATATGSAMLPMILLLFLLSRWSGGLVSRYGARIPLIVGPLIVALGFALFAEMHARGSYWKTDFPASLVLGLGMAVTVAPLTTVVMNSVDQQHAGTASGINNAVARVAGVLAIAVFGSVMMKDFDSRLKQSLANLMLPSNIVEDIRSREVELAGLEPPEGLDPNTIVAIRGAISESFASGFRLVLFCCAGLSIGSALVAWRLIAAAAIGETSVTDRQATARDDSTQKRTSR